MKQLLSAVVVLLFIFLSTNNVVHGKTDYKIIVQDFLPKNAVLLTPKEPPNTSAINLNDVDGDGIEEVSVIYKIKDLPDTIHAMLLKQDSNGNWKKVWDVTGDGYDVQFASFADITGDGIDELIIGWMIGASAGNILEMYQWKGEIHSLEKLKININTYHRLEVLNGENQVVLAVWDRFCCDAYIVDVLRWNGESFESDEDMYAEYFPEINSFYTRKMKKMDAWFYWYALADAQLKANRLEDAQESIRKGFSFHIANDLFSALLKKLAEKQK